MKKIYILLAVSSLLAISCTKQVEITVEQETPATVYKSFSVNVPETKTIMGDGTESKKAVKFSNGDVITVFANTTGNAASFTYNSSTGRFTGELDAADAEETVFYAVYPASFTDKDGGSGSWTFDNAKGLIKASKTPHFTDIAAVEDSFDPTLSFMTAKSELDGSLSFRYGVSFIKISIPVDDAVSLELTAANGRFSGRPDYNVTDGSIKEHNDSKGTITVIPYSSFTKDAVYYIPVIPKNTATGLFTLTYTHTSGVTKSLSTTAFSAVNLVPGNIYDLGSPAFEFAPRIDADDKSIDADDTAGTIDYSIVFPQLDGTLTAALTEASAWFTVGAVDEGLGKVAFTCSANTGDARTATVRLTYTYNSVKTVTKDVTVTQRAPGVAENHVYVLYIDEDKNPVQTKDGIACSYFSHSTSYYNKGFHADFGLGSGIVVNAATYWTGIKIDGSGYCRFTTSATLNTKVSYYVVRRKTGDTTASVKITKTGAGAALRSDAVSYGEITAIENVVLDKNAEYSIQRDASKELALVLVVVEENE